MVGINFAADRKNLLRVRPPFLIGGAIFLAVFFLPDAFRNRHTAQLYLLLTASLSVISGWFLLLKYREINSAWRGWIAVLTSMYLTASIPAFFFELHGLRWLMQHDWVAPYVKPWVHWGFVFVFLGVIGSFFGRGRSRIAFALGSVLLVVLWESMGRWIL